jgi:hypothetical protein
MDPGPFARLLVDLSRAEVRYLVVGGVACNLNEYTRATFDVDLLIDADPENVRRMLTVLSRFGEGHGRELRIADFGDEEGAVRLIEDFPVDIFTRMGGRRYADLLPYRRVFRGDADIPYLDAEGLILLKSGSVREQDRIDVAVLRRLVEERRRRPD